MGFDDDIDYGDGLLHDGQTAHNNRGIGDGRHGDSRVTRLESVAPEVRDHYWQGYEFATKRNEQRGYTSFEPMTIGTADRCPDGRHHEQTFAYNRVTGKTVSTCVRCRRHLG